MTGRQTTSYSDHYSTNQSTEKQREYDRRRLRESRRQAQLKANKMGLSERPGDSKPKSVQKQRGRKVKKPKKAKK